MLKRKFIISIIFIVIGLLITSGKVNATDKVTSQSTINGETITWEYTLNSNGEIEDLVCKNVSDLTGKITIPSAIDEKVVVSIGDNGFKNAKEITEIEIPDSVKKIKFRAFSNCTNLKKIDFGNGVEIIGDYAFDGCTSLTNLKIPKSIQSKDGSIQGVFTGCDNITSIEFEEGVTVIPSSMFRTMKGITEIKIPDSVRKIEFKAFANCTNLKKIDFGNGVEIIGDYAFDGCTSLTSLNIPKSIKSKDGSIQGAFTGCDNITQIVFEEGVTVIPSSMFEKMNGITEITVPDSVSKIEYRAFATCNNLKKITILDNVTSIAKDVFANHNEDLTIYCYEGSVAAKYAIDNNIKYVYLKRASVDELTATVTYNPTTSTTEKVTATIKTNKKVNKVEGWNLSEDGKTLTKVYSENKTETVKLVDEDGLEKSVEVKITNITTKEENKKDTTVTPKENLPQTGANLTIVAFIGIIAIVSFVGYKKIRNYNEIK